VGGGSNQLASAAVSIADSTVAEAQLEMQKLIEVAAEAVDQTLTAESAG
jgi:hypothetical protein